MSGYPHKQLPIDPPPGVPLDQTEAPLYYEGAPVQETFARLWRKFRGVFSARSRQK